MRLDVGCGQQPSGDVNCDLYVFDRFNHRSFGVDGDVIDVRKVPNFVLCDALHLPFRSDCFDDVFCGQLIEHLDDPFGCVRELVRVSCRRVVVETVHRWGEALHWRRRERDWFRVHHVSKFNGRWLKAAVLACGCLVMQSYVVSWFEFPFAYLPWVRVPFCIGVCAVKKVRSNG